MPDSPRRRRTASGELLGSDRQIEDHHRSWIVKHRSAVTSVAVVVVLIAAITAAFLVTRHLGNVSVADPSSSAAAPSTAPTTPATTAHPTTSAPVSPPPAAKITDGTVVAVVSTGRWTVSVEKNLVITVVSNASTKFANNKSASDVKKGAVISVVGTQSGLTVIATSVTIGKKKGS